MTGSDRTGTGQDVGHRIATARRLVLDWLDAHPGEALDWETRKGFMRTRYPVLSEAQRQTALNRATHELEREEKIVDFEEFITRTGVRANEPGPRPVDEVAQELLALDWTGHNWKKWQLQQAIGNVRYVDVFDAVDQLAARGLVRHVTMGLWARSDESGSPQRVEAPVVTPEEERELEADLVARYVAWLRQERGYRIGPRTYENGRIADLFDSRRRLIVEAKASADDVVAAHALGQVCYYRSLELAEDDVAILLPEEPTEAVKLFVDLYAVGLIFPAEGGRFHEDLRRH